MNIDISYELTELDKDLIFFEQGEEALMKHFEEIHPGFREHLDAGLAKLEGVVFGNLVTDRDGTMTNYCGRYLSSV